MLAQCPSCHTIFRIGAEQIKIARGRVRCGVCQTIFDALTHLRDESTSPPETGKAIQTVPPYIPSFSPKKEGPVIKELESLAELHMPQLKSKPDETLVTSPPMRVRETQQLESLQISNKKYPVPYEDVIVEKKNTKKQRKAYQLWVVLVALLLLSLLAQVFWAYGLQRLHAYPTLYAQAKLLCARFGCTIPIRKDLNAIRLISRDIRAHPRYEKSLLVNATIVNDADYHQAFPTLKLSLLDNSGSLVAARNFSPQEYLDSSIDAESGMKQGLPIHIVLEISEPTQQVASFEFDFF